MRLNLRLQFPRFAFSTSYAQMHTPGKAVALDVANFGDGRDVDFSFDGAPDESGILEYRVIFWRYGYSGIFGDSTASALLSASDYVSITPDGSPNYSGNYGMNGDQIGSAILHLHNYKVFVLAVGDGVSFIGEERSVGSSDLMVCDGRDINPANLTTYFWTTVRHLRIFRL